MTTRSQHTRSHAAALARRRAATLTPRQRQDSARRAALARWRGPDHLAGTRRVEDLSVLVGGLPDVRDAEAIIADLRAARRPRGAPA